MSTYMSVDSCRPKTMQLKIPSSSSGIPLVGMLAPESPHLLIITFLLLTHPFQQFHLDETCVPFVPSRIISSMTSTTRGELLTRLVMNPTKVRRLWLSQNGTCPAQNVFGTRRIGLQQWRRPRHPDTRTILEFDPMEITTTTS